MRIVTFTQNQSTRLGLLGDDGITDVGAHNPNLPGDMISLLEGGPDAMQALAGVPGTPDFALGDVHLESPVTRPGKILAVGLNYKAHAEESGMELPSHPIIFTKQHNSINGPYDPIHWSEDAKMLDYEGELAIIIGKRCRRVPKDKAHTVIAGFAVNNDVSVRSWQMRGKPPQFTMGKSWDTHCPLGPALVTADELDPHTLQLKTSVNGDLRQDTNTDDLIFDCYDIIEYLSTAFTLEPGDVIVTGTPSGVGMAMKPPSALAVGDVVKVEIEGLGYIENEVIAEPAEMTCY